MFSRISSKNRLRRWKECHMQENEFATCISGVMTHEAHYASRRPLVETVSKGEVNKSSLNEEAEDAEASNDGESTGVEGIRSLQGVIERALARGVEYIGERGGSVTNRAGSGERHL